VQHQSGGRGRKTARLLQFWHEENHRLLFFLHLSNESNDSFQRMYFHIEGHKIEVVDDFNNLIIFLDKHLTWKTNIDFISSKTVKKGDF